MLQEKPNEQQVKTDAMIRTISTRNAGGRSLEMGRPLVCLASLLSVLLADSTASGHRRCS